MAATPEAETEFKPKYSAEDLRDPTVLATALLDYTPTAIRGMSSDEVDGKLEQALRDGLVRPKVVGDAAQTVDDTFAGKMELESTIPGVQVVLDELKTRKLQVIGEDTENAINDDLGRLPGGASAGDEMVTLVERAYRRGDVTLVETTKAVPAKGTSPGTPGVYEWRPANRREAAIKQAFDRVGAGLDPAEIPKYNAAANQAGQHRADLDRQAKEERSKAREFHEQHKRTLAEEARRKIEAADRLKEGQALDREKNVPLGENRVVAAAGTRVENFDPIMQRDHYERDSKGKRRLVRAQVDASGRLIRDQNVVDSSVHEEALRMNEQMDLERQVGSTRAAEIMAQREREASMDLSRAQASLDVEHRRWETSEPARSTLAHDLWEQSEPQLSDYGTDGTLREPDPEVALDEAYSVDREARGQREVAERYQAMIDAEPDMTIKRQLRAAQEQAVREEKTRQTARTEEIGQIRAEAMSMVPEILTRAEDREHWVGETLHGYTEDGTYDPRAMDRATERLRALGIRDEVDPRTGRLIPNGSPFLEMNRGRTREAYYRVPGNENIIVFERYSRRNGEFISQTIMTTHEPMRQSRVGYPLPPREIRDGVDQARSQDDAIRRVQEGTGLRRIFRATGDYARIARGTGLGTAIGAVEGDAGPYAQRGMTRGRREAMRGRQGRHGGFFYWFWNR